MALNWYWKDKCGEAIFRRKIGEETKDFTVSLYEGNVYLIFIYEYKENGKDMYNLQGFFSDKTHMRRCLGIDKNYSTYGDNIYNDLISIRLNKAKSKNYKEIIKAFVEAFDDIEIGVYTEKGEE